MCYIPQTQSLQTPSRYVETSRAASPRRTYGYDAGIHDSQMEYYAQGIIDSVERMDMIPAYMIGRKFFRPYRIENDLHAVRYPIIVNLYLSEKGKFACLRINSTSSINIFLKALRKASL
jgi:hypothetical protein